ncbi:MAG: glucosamine-6-phosphate deaminase [Planctomycetes bacterium]|nr:glucosamine-6-phosphate deaminase [Planctomycetota bacterium]
MPTFVVDSRAEAEHVLAGEIADLLRARPEAVLGLATGNSPIGVYRDLCALHAAGEVSFARATTFNLDEYLGLQDGDPRTFRRWMQTHLFDHVQPRSTNLPECHAPLASADAVAVRYEQALQAAGGIDLQVLGIGLNGHIGFNEPGSTRTSRTRVVELDQRTRKHAVRVFGDLAQVPTQAITMGVASILDARRLRVLAFGAEKAEIVRRTLFDPISAECPATFLRGHHDVKLYLDAAAAELIEDSALPS